MKNKLLATVMFSVLLACQPGNTGSEVEQEEPSYPEAARDHVIYEVNIRQYTEEGTIAAFAKHLPRLKSLGVDILWIMPIQPIGELNRKGSLGSYYSIQDYSKVNPEFGTLEHFKSMVEEAHKLGMTVMLDWVANHTAWDHPWMEKEGYHTKDSLGNVVPPVPDWSDVADLNYDNLDMQQDMIAEMKYWVKEADIDGFRCDMAGMVPNEFWKQAMTSLRKEKDLFMLAEWDDPSIHESFHMSYNWEAHHLMNDIARQDKPVSELVTNVQEDLTDYGSQAFRLNFLTNHDENSWKGSIPERFGDSHEAFAVLSFTLPGMPLLYSGQEAGLAKRLAFFEKDTINWGTYPYQDFYQSLIALKKSNEALYNGKHGGVIEFLPPSNDAVMAFKRTKNQNEVTVLINLSDKEQQVDLQDITLADYFTGSSYRGPVILSPYQYIVGINNLTL